MALTQDLFRILGFPAIHINNSQSPLKPGQMGRAFKRSNEPREEELVVKK